MKQTGLTDIGLVRNNNQDTYGFGVSGAQVPYGFVCDGMGGPGGGEIASRIAHDMLIDFLKKAKSGKDVRQMIENLRGVLKAINTAIITRSSEKDEYLGMGTTLVAAFFFGKQALIANIGDSRAYLMQNGDIMQISKDHSVVQELIDMGSISAMDAANHPQKNIITRALGAYEDAEADYFIVNVSENAKILLCSDGLSNLVDIHEIQLELDINTGIDEAAETLMASAKERGGTDNITIVIMAKD